jgi:hypothetical protein
VTLLGDSFAQGAKFDKTFTNFDPGDPNLYHQDQRGSVQVISDGAGACTLQTRYTPYGDVRERRDCLSGAANAVGGAHRYEFTD